MSSGRARRAFSLVELLVVLAILGLLMGMLMSAIQKVRAAAARLRCVNQVRQIALGLHQYHGVHQNLPPGIAHPASPPGSPNAYGYGPDTDPYPLLNWQARILPFVEQEALWKRTEAAFAKDKYEFLNPPHLWDNVVVPLFNCPADQPVFYDDALGKGRLGTTSYLGVSGTNDARRDGLLYMDSSVRFTDIIDGTSNTLMVGERPPSLNGDYGRWYGGWGPWGMANAYLGTREAPAGEEVGCHDSPYPFALDRLDNVCSTYHFWSFHTGGANFAFADGSVRFLRYPSNPLMGALATRAGLEVVPLED